MQERNRIKVPFSNALIGFAVKFVCLVALLSLGPLLRAQSFYGTVVGTVTDPSGAVVPDATVTLTNVGTAEAAKVQTGADGEYSVVNLVPANYRVTVEKPGFKRAVREGLQVQVGTTARVNLSLAVGNVSETVQVSTQAPLLQTDTSSLNQVVEGAQVQEMPLNGRNVLNLLSLAPGVIANGGASGSTGLDQQGKRSAGGLGWGNYQIGGAISGQAAQFVDGAANNLLGDNIVALVPTQDAVQEFSVLSSDAPADFGRYAGGVVNMTTKSGTNRFHGTAYEYLRNTDFNANDWFSNLNGQQRQDWKQNQFGAGINGPIMRDKAFFMFTWEEFRSTIGYLNPTNVPTVAMQNGVFLGKTISDPLYNPVTGAGCNVQPIPAAGVTVNGTTYTGTGTYIANLYQGSCGDPLNRILKTFYPAPNNSSTAANWFQSTPLGNTQYQYNARGDYNISEKQRLFARYSYWNVKDTRSSEFRDQGFGGTTWPTADTAQWIFTQQAVLGDTYTFNPTTVLDVRVDWTRVTNPDTPENINVNQTQFDQYNPNKVYTALSPEMSVRTLPAYLLSGSDNLFGLNNYSNLSINWYNNYALSANVVKILGRHSVKIGGEGRLMDSSGTGFEGAGAGSYSYTNAFTGDEFASFLMGYPTTNGGAAAVQFQTYTEVAGYSYYQGYYATDTWQATRNLTLNLGLRYELPGGIAERNNKMAVLLPNATDPYTGITGTEALVDSPLYKPRTVQQEKYDLFAPRLGFAYHTANNTVVRGGYGISYLPNDLSGIFGYGVMPYASVLNSYTTTVNISTSPVQLQTPLGCLAGTITGGACTSLGIQQAGIVQPPGRSQPNFMTRFGSLTSYLGQTIAAPDPYQNYPMTQQWNLGVSHEFKGDLMAEVSYAGLHGDNIPSMGYGFVGNSFSLDELSSQYYSLSAISVPNPTNPAQPYNGLTAPTGTAGAPACNRAPGLVGKITVGQCLRPNPYYNDVEDTNHLDGRQNYKSLQVKTEKRFKSAGIIMANYVWSRNMANADTLLGNLEQGTGHQVVAGLQDYNNVGAEYSLLAYDVKNRFVASYLLNLPFGKGQKLGANLHGVADKLASGWALDGITTIQSGFPIFLVEANPNLLSSFGGGQLRPNVVPGCNKKIAGSNQTRVLAGAWFNTSCFSSPSAASFGNEPRVDPDLRADGIKNFDMSLQKSTALHESVNFVFRAEFFNIFNRVQFDEPNNAHGSAGFGEPTFQVNHPRQIQLSGRINF